MKVWMLVTMTNGYITLERRVVYEVPDSWGKLMCKEGEVSAEYVEVKGQ